jgi:hypothetical protein
MATTLIPLCLLHHQEVYEAEARLLSGWELWAINHNSESACCSYLRGILYIKANVVSVCLCVRHRHSRITARVAAVGGRARCHGLLYIQCGCMMQFGAKRAQRARRGCTRHDERAKPAWATRTRPAGAPQAYNTLIYMHYGQAQCQFAWLLSSTPKWQSVQGG